MTSEFIKALGWQGGTVHQAISEVKQLRLIEKAVEQLLIARVNDGYSTICRCCGGRTCTDHCIYNILTEESKDRVRHALKNLED